MLFLLTSDVEAGVYDDIAPKPGSYPAVRIEDIELSEDTTINFELEPGGCLIPESVFEAESSTPNR
ncbi:MAG: hypothetical protein Q7J16_07795 [Candidatus Cloacimonadales bacterium]|nr:hypothetical protein [Candidatus Cloacimonadales bacterium]